MEFVLINHAELTEEHLYSIAKIKSQHWLYPIESQIEWIQKTYNSLDTHVFLLENNTIIGYVSIVDLKIVANGKSINSLGLSCLCIDKQYSGNGYGLLVMERAIEYANKNKKSLCLLCNEKLVNHYSKIGFRTLTPFSINVNQTPFTHKFMVYDNDTNTDVKDLKEAQEVSIDRNF